MALYRKRPVVVDAEQWFPGRTVRGVFVDESGAAPDCYVVTIHRQRSYLDPGDWVIAEPDGEHFYPCKPAVFAASYEALADPIPRTEPARQSGHPRAAGTDPPVSRRYRRFNPDRRHPRKHMPAITEADLAELERLSREASAGPWYLEKGGICGDAGQTYRLSAQFTTAGGMREADGLFCVKARAAMAQLLLLARVGRALDDAIQAGSPLAYLAEPMAAVATYLEADRRVAAALATYRAGAGKAP